MPRRPTKQWWDSCDAGVSSGGSAYDPKRVCGKVWSRKPIAEREAIARAEERSGSFGGRRFGNWPARQPFNPKAFEHELRELDLFIDNDAYMDRRKQSFIANVRKKIAGKRYDPSLANELWQYWVDEGAQRYVKEHGGDIRTMFPLALRKHLAKIVAKHEYGRITRGEYD